MRAYFVTPVIAALSLCAAWIAFPSPGGATAQSGGAESYGAIATRYSGSVPFKAGTAANQNSRAAAAQRALAACGSSDCVLVLEFSGRGCGAYQASDNGGDYAWGWAMEPRQADADRLSLRQCQGQLRPGETCSHRARVCNSRGGTPQVIAGKGDDEDEDDDW